MDYKTSQPPASVLIARGSASFSQHSATRVDQLITDSFGFQGIPTTDFIGWRHLHLHKIVWRSTQQK